MAGESFTLSIKLPAKAARIYKAWLNSDEHSMISDGSAKINPQEGSDFSAGDNYITGKILELEENQRILHLWRTTEFPEDAEDSYLELLFEEEPDGTVLILNHWNIPEGQGERYRQGWQEYYFKPMRSYFNGSPIYHS